MSVSPGTLLSRKTKKHSDATLSIGPFVMRMSVPTYLEFHPTDVAHISDKSLVDYLEKTKDQSYIQCHREENKLVLLEQDVSGVVTDIPGECLEYMDPADIAKKIVDSVIEESQEFVQKTAGQQTEDKVESPRTTISFPSTGFGFVETSKRSFTAWPTIENFTVEVGAYKIDEYLASFDTEEDWVYAIYYQGVEERDCSDLYKYQAIYSLPTWRYPIAQATASIYFVIEVCKAKPGYCPVDVTFNYETFRHINKPGAQDFREKWLHYVLDSKINLFKTLTY